MNKFSNSGLPGAVLGLGLFAFVSGCATLDGTTQATAQQQRDQRQELNEGYSLLYDAVNSLRHTDKAFYVKLESDRVERVIGNVSDYADQLAADLERIARDYPAVKINLDPLPEIEKRKRSSLTNDTLKSLAPVVGKTGAAFERRLLLSTSGALSQLQFQCQVMAAEEPVDSLIEVLFDAENRFAELYEDVVVLLNEAYFIHNTYEPAEQ